MATAPRTILLVEDEALIALSEAKQLRSVGYDVVHSFTGEKAIEIVRASPGSIDLILMDIDLGSGIDGTEAAQEIHRSYDIPVLFLSSHVERDMVEKTESITNYGYVVKASTFTVLDASIKMALKLFAAQRRINEINSDFEATNEELRVSLDNLQKERDFSEAVLQGMPGYLYVYDEAGRLVKWNKKHEEMTGYSGEELSLMSLDKWFEGEDALRVAAAVEEVFRTGYGEVEADLIVKGGGKKRIRSSGVRIMIDGKPFFTGVGIDISELRKAEDALRASENRWMSIIAASPDGIAEIAADGRIVFASAQCLSLLGYSRADELIGRSLEDFFEPERRTAAMAYLRGILGGEARRNVETTLVRKDGSLVPVEINPEIVKDSKSDSRDLLVVIRDVSDRRDPASRGG
jgi:PAS domain S-box-containing protein